MSLSVGIVGLPNVGKSTLFNALLKKQQALAANYPFATIEPNVGIVPVPDIRLLQLANAVATSENSNIENRNPKQSQNTNDQMTNNSQLPPLVPATVTFTDIAGIVKGASEGEGLGNKFLSHIREANAICLVVRAFEDANVVLTGSGEPSEDKDTLMMELILADMQTVDKQIQPKGKITPEQAKRWSAIEKIKTGLDENKRADECGLDEEESELVKDLCLMTMKPILYVVNIDEAELSVESVEELANMYAKKLGVENNHVMVICAKVEADLAGLSDDEQREYLQTLGVVESGLERLISKAYKLLGLQSFLTAGMKECRAWTISTGMNACEAAGVIHTDFMKKFIKADVIGWQDFVSLGGWKKAREVGKVRSEGRDYIMQDGDVVEFRIGG